MEFVSTSNLVSSKTEKITTACNLQVTKCHMIWWETKSQAKILLICSFMMAEIKRNSVKNSKTKPTNQKLKKVLWKCVISCNNLIRAKEGWWNIYCKTTDKLLEKGGGRYLHKSPYWYQGL